MLVAVLGETWLQFSALATPYLCHGIVAWDRQKGSKTSVWHVYGIGLMRPPTLRHSGYSWPFLRMIKIWSPGYT
jgi:hypothetical protein